MAAISSLFTHPKQLPIDDFRLLIEKPHRARFSINNQQCFYWYGIMRFTLRLSPSLTSAGDPRFRFRFLLFDVRMCRRCDRPRFTFPVPVTLKRLAAPLCVFNFGIKSLKTAVSSQLSVKFHSRNVR